MERKSLLHTVKPYGNGNFDIEGATVEGHRAVYNFPNGHVPLPIMSTGRMTDPDDKLLYHTTGGENDHPDGQTRQLVRKLVCTS